MVGCQYFVVIVFLWLLAGLLLATNNSMQLIIHTFQLSFQFLQKHAILVDTNLLKIMPNALASPFPEMFYVQAKMSKADVSICKSGIIIYSNVRLFVDGVDGVFE